jgi:hypothetical protein
VRLEACPAEREFGGDGTIYVAGIGDDFVVPLLAQWDQAGQTSDLSLSVGRLHDLLPLVE